MVHPLYSSDVGMISLAPRMIFYSASIFYCNVKYKIFSTKITKIEKG